jgi:hypothetical protein
MPFIYEKISEEETARIDWSQFKIWPDDKRGLQIPPASWAVDRQRPAFLFGMIGRGRENQHPPVDAFVWRGAFVRMEVNIETSATRSGEIEILYDVLRMDMPREIQHERTQIMDAIREAADPFVRRGRSYTRELESSGPIAPVLVRFPDK